MHCIVKNCIAGGNIVALRRNARLNIQQKRESLQFARKLLAARQTESRQRPASDHHPRHFHLGQDQN